MACNMCGRCCRNFSVPRVNIYNFRNFLKEHPYLEVVDWGGTEKCMIPIFKCNRLEKGIDDTFVCKKYKNRPDFCRAFPQTNQKKPGVCTA